MLKVKNSLASSVPLVPTVHEKQPREPVADRRTNSTYQEFCSVRPLDLIISTEP